MGNSKNTFRRVEDTQETIMYLDPSRKTFRPCRSKFSLDRIVDAVTTRELPIDPTEGTIDVHDAIDMISRGVLDILRCGLGPWRSTDE